MRKALLNGLRIAVPVGLGIWLIHYFYKQLDEQQRGELFMAFREANWWWLGLSVLCGMCSHMSRAWRWRYLLNYMGHRPGYWNAYNATMSGYFMNLLLPRAGEATRAVLLYRSEGVPFEKGFGTILAERAVDMVVLACITAVTLLLQLDKLELLQERILFFRDERAGTEGSNGWGLVWIMVPVVVLSLVTGAYLVMKRPAVRSRLRDGIRGLMEGLRSVFLTPDKIPFIAHTLLIWGLYVAMFWVGFFALETTAEVPPAGIMAGFIAGSVGIILVQGGIGVYPAFVALIVSVYMAPPEGGGLLRPDALAMGWLLWVAQTVMVIVLGGISLLLISNNRKSPE